MVNTLTNYRLIAADIDRSVARIAQQPMVSRESQYYLENITKVKTIEEFVGNTRLFNYAMKAHGLEDMAFAKAFMVKVLEEGVSDPDSFANKLTDKRYAEFARAFDFEARGANATTFNPARDGAIERYTLQALADLVPLDTQREEIGYYLDNIVKVRSVAEFVADDRLLDFALQAHDLEHLADDKPLLTALLQGGVADPASLANTSEGGRYAEFVRSFDFAGLGENATTINPAQQPAIDKYLRQSLEEDAGAQNEGVRLALYFERKSGEIDDWYDILADPALAQVVRTALGLPASFAQTDIDRQVAFFESRMDVSEFAEPAGLEKFLTRFTALWEVENPSGPAMSAASVLIGQPVEFGISSDVLFTLARMKR